MALKGGPEDRKYFRLSADIPCTFRLKKVGSSELGNTKFGRGQILDVGGGGLCFRCDYDFPIRRTVILSFQFSLMEGQRFVLDGELLRKMDTREEFVYGVQFKDIPEAERERLIGVLEELLAKRRLLRPELGEEEAEEETARKDAPLAAAQCTA